MSSIASPAPFGPPLRAWSILAILSLLLFLITASTYSSLGVVLPSMIRDEHWSFGTAFLGFTLLGAFTGGSSWLPAILIRRIGVPGAILAGSAIMVAGFACLASTHGLAVYLFGTALLGVGYQAMALIPGTHVLSMLFQKRALPFGVYFTTGSLGGVAGPWMVLAVMGAHGAWRPYWWAQGAAAAVVGVLCAAMIGRRAWLEAASAKTDAAVVEDARAAPPNARIHRTARNWTVAEALRTPQFYVLMVAYFSHLLGGITSVSLAPAQFAQLGVVSTATVATVLSLESLMQVAARLGGGFLADRIDPKWLLAIAQGFLALGILALGWAANYPLMLVFAIGTGIGFGLTVLAVSILLLNYFGRGANLQLFSLVCLTGTPAALGPFIGGAMRDALGGFTPTFELFAITIGLIAAAVVFMRPPMPAPQMEAAPDILPSESDVSPIPALATSQTVIW